MMMIDPRATRLISLLCALSLLATSAFAAPAGTPADTTLGTTLGAIPAGEPVTPAEHRRGVEQTYLTYPEWFLVHSPAEYAAYIATSPPSDFPYFGHIAQFWESYRAVSRQAERYPPNVGYHVMIVVIGASTTLEYGVKSAYETLIGRLTELTASGPTAEDRFAAATARDYVDFIRVRPWYEFDFLGRLRELWSQTSMGGQNMLRKWERKFALTSEYGAKAIYGWIIGKLTKIGYEDPLPVTAAWVSPLPPDGDAQLPELRRLRQLPDGSGLVTVPRYAAFTNYARELARRGVRFREIAGNRTEILVSVLAPEAWRWDAPAGSVLFTQPILTVPSLRRTVAVVPVTSLDGVLRALDRPGFEIEHIYDY